MNSVVRQMWEQNTDVVMVDTGNSYEGLCEYVGGKYISYTDEHPITMNPFAIKREELNIEKIGFLKNLIMLIWKGTQREVTKTEDRLVEQVITEYFDEYFIKKRIDNLSFNTFYEYSTVRIPTIIKENNLAGIDLQFIVHPAEGLQAYCHGSHFLLCSKVNVWFWVIHGNCLAFSLPAYAYIHTSGPL